jgi:hypothetical protein
LLDAVGIYVDADLTPSTTLAYTKAVNHFVEAISPPSTFFFLRRSRPPSLPVPMRLSALYVTLRFYVNTDLFPSHLVITDQR